MLSDENDIQQLFSRVNQNNNLLIALAVEDEIIISNEVKNKKSDATVLIEQSDYIIYKQIGFIPFQLLISYDNTENLLNWIVWIIMIAIG